MLRPRTASVYLRAPTGARARDQCLARAIPWLVALGLVAISIVLHAPYFAQTHVEDDIDHLMYLAEYRDGTRSLAMYLLAPVNEHLVPAWRAGYLLAWHAFGLSPTGWHVAIALAHGLSATMLFVILRVYTGETIAATCGAALWTAAGIGGWDNPLSWIASSHLAWGVAWLLAAMACLTRYREGGMRWPILMAVCLIMSIASMSAMWALAPILVVQWWLLERDRNAPAAGSSNRPGAPSRPSLSWAVAWLVSFVALAPFSILGALQIFEPNPLANERSLIPALVRAPAAFLLAGENLLYRDVRYVPGVPWSGRGEGALTPVVFRALVAVVVCALLLALPGRSRRPVLLWLVLAIGYGFLVHWARSSFADDYALMQGRYAYLPTLAWCGIAGTLVAAMGNVGTSWYRTLFRGAAIALTVILIGQQWHTTNRTAGLFEQATAAHRADFRLSRELLAELSAEARRSRVSLRLSDFTWMCRPAPVSARRFCLVAFPKGLPDIDFVPAMARTPDDIARLDAALARSINPFRWTFAYALAQDQRLAELLDRLHATTASDGRPLTIPNIRLLHPQAMHVGPGLPQAPRANDDPHWGLLPTQQRLSDLARRLGPTSWPRLMFVPPGKIEPDERARLDRTLREIGLPVAAAWRDLFGRAP